METQDENIKKVGGSVRYGGIKMRSLLEKKLAILLDSLDIKWEYENEYFTLKEGEIVYLPDFYLPKHNQYIEVKGVLQEKDKEKVERFAREKEDEIMIFKSTDCEYIATFADSKQISWSGINLNHCYQCGEYSFVPNVGSWHCRSCGYHDGDHDIITYGIMKERTLNHPNLQLINEKEIKKWVEMVRNLK